jgi:hypothetical protein
MPERKILTDDFHEEKLNIESTGRYRVTGRTPVPKEKGYSIIHFVPTRQGKRPVRSVKGIAKVSGHIEYSRSRRVARRIFDLQTPGSKKPARAIAERWMRAFADELGIRKDLSDLHYDHQQKTKKSIFGRHVLYQQYVGQTPISGAWIRVDIDDEGRVFNIQNDLVPTSTLARRGRAANLKSRLRGDEAEPITEELARRIALDLTRIRKGGRRRVLGKPELTYRPTDGEPRLAWKLVVGSTAPKGEWKTYIDAFTGEILWRQNVLKSATPRARVFDPNPVVALNTANLSNRSPIPDSAYRTVELRGLDGSGRLDGPYVSTRLTRRRVRRSSGDFRFRRGQRGFTETMAYFHIDRIQRHLQALGFTNLLHRGIDVNVAGQREDNSYYSQTDKILSFGTGGVDDAEDAETILHEYGHAIQDAQVPGWGEGIEGAAMGEGFGDFLAASFFADWKPAWLRPAISSWDCIAWEGNPPALRRMDGGKRYPRDITGEEHDDGEIWSACLWELGDALGRGAAEKLIVAHHYLLNRWAGFEEAANALLSTDRRLSGGRNQSAIRDVFIRRGILKR